VPVTVCGLTGGVRTRVLTARLGQPPTSLGWVTAVEGATGEKDVDMHKVVAFAVRRNLDRLPAPQDPLERLAKEYSAAAREEIRYDNETRRPYRANHCFSVVENGKQMHLWLDIDDDAPRHKMVKARNGRREQMIGDGLQLTLDLEHWNRINPTEEPITADMDLTDEIEWRKNAPNEDEKAS
jgi:hypothetical protein